MLEMTDVGYWKEKLTWPESIKQKGNKSMGVLKLTTNIDQ